MKRVNPSLFAAVLVAASLFSHLVAQELPGLRLSLQAREIVPAAETIDVALIIDVEQDTEVPAVVLNGLDVTVRVGGVEREPVQVAGRGGAVPFERGTRIVRPLRLPAAKVLGDAARDEVQQVSVAWRGLIGVDCSFKLAPDTTGLSVDDLDLVKTEVVLSTNYGEIRLAFRPDKAPNHVRNFVKLCLQGFYDGTKFHRVMRNFMIQGGCPFTKDDAKKDQWGTGGPGYQLDAEFSDLRHLRGTLSMARSPTGPDTAGSGFFIVHKDSGHLDRGYSAFGNVLEGMDVVDAIADVQVGGAGGTTPVRPVILQNAIVLPVKK